jgi:hypothetical protein
MENNIITPINWLYKKLQSECLIDMADELFQQAIEMEENHIKMAFNDGRITGSFKKVKNSHDYFKETYGTSMDKKG